MKVLNSFVATEAVEYMKQSIPDDFFDLTVTSPPYDDLRCYKGYRFDADEMIKQLFRVTKLGGIVVWVIGDRVNNGRSLTSFEHGLLFRDAGFLVHDVMIYQKKNTPFMRSNAYTNCYEFMIVLSKGKPSTFNPLKVPTKRHGMELAVHNKGPDAINKKNWVELKKEKTKTNIWSYAVGFGGTTRDKIAFKHPAVFPEKLAQDHILSWTNEGDIVFDPMCGSGTTCKMAALNNRKWLGLDISKEYIGIANERMQSWSKECV
ncbi:MAG: site-specific DNA-methyltransferase [Alphaproteobacteria bacterium]|nr:site-specific DNA-methyltransferase [Alphaproteobacteria bacterium]